MRNERGYNAALVTEVRRRSARPASGPPFSARVNRLGPFYMYRWGVAGRGARGAVARWLAQPQDPACVCMFQLIDRNLVRALIPMRNLDI